MKSKNDENRWKRMARPAMAGLLLNLAIGGAFAQNAGTVQGTVKDSNGNPVVGASVFVKGNTNKMTVTDNDGNFKINAAEGTKLVVSCVGYNRAEVSATTSQPLQVVVKDVDNDLNEVVVVGFATQKKVNLTGSVATVSSKELQSRPVTDVTQAIQGLVPGLQVSNNSGALDGSASINVRGTGTIGSGSSGSPLVLIDGMEGDMTAVNPEDIENISVLKDAAASSIYGSRAPFGVILITTKKGKAGKATINYNNNFRIASPIHLPESMDSYTFALYFNQAQINNHKTGDFTDDVLQQMLDFQAQGGTNKGGLPTDGKVWGKPAGDPFTKAYANTDWFHEMYADNVFSQEHNVSINGGGEKVQYYASLGYLDQGGLLRYGSDDMKRYNLTAKINAELTSWLDFSYSLRFTRRDINRPTKFNQTMLEKVGRQTWPNLPVFDENGYFFNSNAETPVMSLAEGGRRVGQSDNYYHQAAFVIEPIKDWKTHFEFNYSTNARDVKEADLPVYNHKVDGSIDDTHGNSSLYVENKKENYLNWNIYSEYSRTFNEVHNAKVMVGYQSEEMKQTFNSTKKYGLLDFNRPFFDLTTNTSGDGKQMWPEIAGYHNEWATVGFFGRLNYDYKGIYLFEGNLRYDGTSRFRRGNRWQWNPSFSFGWNIANEAFWENLRDEVGTLKLRLSYGSLGNQNTNDWYPTYRTITVNTNYGTWLQNGVKTSTSWINDLISTSLTWERVSTWNVGLDWGLFNNRLTGSLDVYTRYTKNMVGPAPELPNILGATPPKTNNCDLKTQGWELSLQWKDRLENGLGYNIRATLSDAKTIIDSYPSNTTGSIDTYNKGREIGEIWGFETVGIAKTQEEMDAHLAKVGGQSFGTEWTAGDIMYADLDGKPGITEGARTLSDHGDLKVIGNNTPRYFLGINLGADWKGIDFSMFWQGVLKRDFWQGSNMFWGTMSDMWWSTGLKEHEDYFRAEPIGLAGHEIPANVNSYYPRPVFGSMADANHKTQTRYLQNAAYMRLKNIQLGYTLPSDWMKTIGFTRCRIYVSGENLLTITKLSDLFDPETLNGGSDNNANGAVKNGGNGYPLSRTWSFGLSLTF